MNVIRHIIRGLGDLPGYGPHPGTGIVSFYIFCAGLAGAQRGGLDGFLGGLAIGAIAFLPFYFGGAYSRSKDLERDQISLMKKIKDA